MATVKGYVPRQPVKLEVTTEMPCCPDCKQPLDELSMVNGVDECVCGFWSYDATGVLGYRKRRGDGSYTI